MRTTRCKTPPSSRPAIIRRNRSSSSGTEAPFYGAQIMFHLPDLVLKLLPSFDHLPEFLNGAGGCRPHIVEHHSLALSMSQVRVVSDTC